MILHESDTHEAYDPETTSDLSDMHGELSLNLYRYWDSLRNGRAMPTWNDFSLMDIYATAPYLLVLDVVRGDDGPVRHKYRFVGTKIVQYRRKRKIPDHTGMFADEAPGIIR